MLENIVPLTPVHFFAFQADCHYLQKEFEKKHLLPDLTSFHGEFSFADVFLGWNERGIFSEVHIKENFESPSYPDIELGDAIEFFIDTRDIKTSGYPTRFCHHFFFLPEPVESEGETVQAGELTKFRAEDSHPLCDSKLLWVQRDKKKKKNRLNIFIPSECLHGYDPIQFNRLGFCYRIHRENGFLQYFTANDSDFSIAGHPALWASLTLRKDVK